MFPWLWPSKNRATAGVATATPRPIGFLADVRAVVPNLSTGNSGKDRREGQGKVGAGYVARRGR